MSGESSGTLAAWLQRLEGMHPRGSDGIELGLTRVAEVKARLGQVEKAPIILVAGTNGKGSTCAMLEAILRSAGYRVGLYTSPHLLRYNERVCVDGQPATDQALVAAFAEVEAARRDTPLTYFEFGTLAAVQVFAANAVDVVILEVGLGGRLDATNIYTPACAIVTTVDLDHMEFLGPDRQFIGREKAGIFRPGVPAICGDPSPPASLSEYALHIGADLQVLGKDFGFMRQEQQWRYWGRGEARAGLAYPSLRGRSQLANAASALAALDTLRDTLPVAVKDIRYGLLEAEIAGRFQVLPGQPTIVLDVAHNAQSVRVLDANLSDMAFHPATWAVFGMLADKDVDTAIALLKDRVTHWLPCSLTGRRAASADFLTQRLQAQGITPLALFPGPGAALAHAQEKAVDADRILVFGSFLTVAGALEHLGRPV
ncbi:MAG: bifunctional tetrahydrofolate synthase/dihydrofolate synthase [Rhodocyclaceae bacterium]|jgi:dihydrofolate synthase/folylpolyglutamate synthase|nr:bifunctional tetrahydrofolate synthase/dihydrofolate synthase [Rhodocyclaceae bacterium]